jgi:addiction module RelE/StbE family toxin
LKLRFSARARLQLLAIQEYIAKNNPDAASRVGSRIREAAEVLRFFPHAVRAGRSAGTREWVLRGLPYVLVYEVDIHEVIVLSIFHGAQKRD